jgi:hypothetical protein
MIGFPTILHDSRLADGVLTASGTAAGYDVSFLTDFRPYTWWKPDALPATADMIGAAAGSADYALIYGHDLGTQGATVEIRGSDDGFAADDNLIASVSPGNDDPILLQFNTATYDDWRLRITGPSVPAIAIAAIGMKLTFTRRLQKGFDPIGRKVSGQTTRSVKGQPLGAVYDYEEWSESVHFRNLTMTWVRGTWKSAFDSHLKNLPFVFAWDPDDHADEIYLVQPLTSYKTPHQGGEFADLQFQLSGVV